MTGFEHRKSFLEQVQDLRNSKVILYVTGDRLGLETKIGQDVIDLFIDHLDAMGPVPKISLVLYTPGGDTAAAWNLVNLVRMFCDEFEVITPSKCRSSGTLICLGSDRIVMTKQATLGPIDPTLHHQLGPAYPNGNKDARVAVSVEAVNSYLDAAKNYGGGDDAATRAFLYLSKKVNPLVLGEIFRSRQQIRDLATRLLAMQQDINREKVEREKVEKIVDFLCSESGGHDYTINRREALELGLRVEKCDSDLYHTVKEISRSYSQELGFREPLKTNEFLLQDASNFRADLIGKPINFEYSRAVIESCYHDAHYFVSRGILEVIKNGDEVSIRENRNFEGWEVRS
ncbi:MAG: serine protease [Gammaproteobacteria bacterium]|nr:serine protease [Gammaproteobacteria bacterium]